MKIMWSTVSLLIIYSFGCVGSDVSAGGKTPNPPSLSEQSSSSPIPVTTEQERTSTPPAGSAPAGETVSLDPAEYAAYFEQCAAKKYSNISVAIADRHGWPETLSGGMHRLVVSKRETGAVLRKLYVGPVGSLPESSATGGQFLEPASGADGVWVDTNHTEATIPLVVPGGQTSEVWGFVEGENEDANSFLVSLDGSAALVWGFPVTGKDAAQWYRIEPRALKYYAIDCFWLTWAATSQLSGMRNDPQLTNMAKQLTEAAIDGLAHRKVQPAQLWFLEQLETVRLWQEDDRTPEDYLAVVMERIRPYVQNCYAMTQTPSGWQENTPNIQIQAAAILRLASVMWEKSDSTAAREWAEASQECLDRAWRYKLDTGGFGYSYGSGMDASYFAFDSEHLTRYYLLTQDPSVLAALQEMGAIAENFTRSGLPVSFGSPWWKHTLFTRDVLPEIFLHFNANANYAHAVVLSRLRALGGGLTPADTLMAYYNMLLPSIETTAAPYQDGAVFSTLENGPFLRAGQITVGMPWRSWSETTCGVAYSHPDTGKMESTVCSAILTASTRDTAGKKDAAYYPIAYSVIEQVKPEPETRAVICGPDFIASATCFRPALGGPALPEYVGKENDSPWLRTDIHFANRNGTVCALELKALRDNDSPNVSLWLHLSDAHVIKGNHVQLHGMKVTVEDRFAGAIQNLGTTWGYSAGTYPLNLLEAVVAERQTGGFTSGETFRTRVAVNLAGESQLSLGAWVEESGCHVLHIRSGGEPYALLLFNMTGQPTSVRMSSFALMKSLWQSGAEVEALVPDANAESVVVPPRTLILAR